MRFSVVGADKETGDDVDVVLIAASREVAELEACKKGILVAAIKELPEEKDVIELVMDDGPEKQKVIDEMVAIVQQDAIWSFGWFPFASGAYQPWVYNGKPSILVRDMAKYYRIDPVLRAQKQAEWNKPAWWPPVLIVLALLAVAWAGRRTFQRRERLNARGEVLA